ncbi:unnamed protein product [Plutella xylostella]|uniref:(diamondback moth) hypothetical protein n=1 Tax=Plutella xylostella TaxID=51655 RepID=A0A8S4EYI7_PLUXY|nr:unnamed protein product [Plutella xylostella]
MADGAPRSCQVEGNTEDPLQAYRAVRILRPSTDLSGNYTCAVSTFMHEDRRTRHMLVYSPGKSFHFIQEKKYVFLVTLKCVAEELYPKPEMSIISQGEPLKQTVTEVVMNSWGLYRVSAAAVVHDDDVAAPAEQFVCELRLPPSDLVQNRTTLYHRGLMPTSQIIGGEPLEKAQERHSNGEFNYNVMFVG